MVLKRLFYTFHMISYGLNHMSFYKTKEYSRHVPLHSLPTTQERWAAIGDRFRNALKKVVDENRQSTEHQQSR